MNKDKLIGCKNRADFFRSNLEVIPLNLLNEFFKSNVCIPKGENRHPYSDVLHEWVEGVNVEYFKDGTWREEYLPSRYWTTLRIKPPEPIYEWLWYNKSGSTQWWTSEESNSYSSNGVNDGDFYFKAEETKRERK